MSDLVAQSSGWPTHPTLLTDLVSWCREHDLGVRLHVTEGNQVAHRRGMIASVAGYPQGRTQPPASARPTRPVPDPPQR